MRFAATRSSISLGSAGPAEAGAAWASTPLGKSPAPRIPTQRQTPRMTFGKSLFIFRAPIPRLTSKAGRVNVGAFFQTEVRHGNTQTRLTAREASRARRFVERRRENVSVALGLAGRDGEGFHRGAPRSGRDVRDRRLPPGAERQGDVSRSRRLRLGRKAERVHDVLV